MKFSIITPTYRRADKLVRAIRSVQAQTYPDWEMIIINDSPADTSYAEFASSINDPRIRYMANDRNMGVNFSRNRALDAVSATSDWVVFLDDDDYLAPDALMTFQELARDYQGINWFITNRAYKDGTPVTNVKNAEKKYSYAWDYLLFRRIRGDATHIIKTKCINHVRFSKHVKQGEEWIFFYQLGLTEKLFYHDHNSTITDGYDIEHGLNFRARSYWNRFEDLLILFGEGVGRGFVRRPTFLLYFTLRILRITVKP